jgi:hypothetical protein
MKPVPRWTWPPDGVDLDDLERLLEEASAG